MGIKSVYKRAEYGQQLFNQERQGERAIAELEGLRQTLPLLRDAINADEDLSASEKADAVAEVNTVITELVTAVKAFAASL